MTSKKLMKGLLGATALTVLSTGTAFAQNNFTPADTTVSNTFTLDYTVGTVAQPQIDNTASPTDFKVDRLVNVTVASTGGGADLAPGTEDAQVTFTVKNDGNDTHAYALDVEDEGSPDFTLEAANSGNEILYYGDEDGNGVIDGNEATAASPKVYDPSDDTTWPVLAPDATITVIVEHDIPTSADDDDEAEIYLSAETRDETTPATVIAEDTNGNDSSLTENVFADLSGDATGDAAEDGTHSATGVYSVNAAEITATKDVFVLSDATPYTCAAIPGGYTPPAPSTDAPVGPVTNNGYNTPGACVEYFITVRNAGSADATGIVLTDILPDNLTFVSAAAIGDLTGTLAFPTTPTTVVCDGTDTTCEVELTAGTMVGTTTATPSEGHLIIRATID